MAEIGIWIVRSDNGNVAGSRLEGGEMTKGFQVSRRGRQRAFLGADINFCCSYSCSSVIRVN
jgi:hypothetical protein